MKKLIALVLLLALLIPACFAEGIDLSALSFEELAALRDRIQLEMMARDEWQEVTVPAGLWEVGVDIPAGTWLVKCADEWRNNYSMRLCDISWGKGRPYNEKYGLWSATAKGDVEIYNPNSSEYEGGTTEFIVTVEDGDFIFISPDHNQAVFMPYTGKQNLGFK